MSHGQTLFLCIFIKAVSCQQHRNQDPRHNTAAYGSSSSGAQSCFKQRPRCSEVDRTSELLSVCCGTLAPSRVCRGFSPWITRETSPLTSICFHDYQYYKCGNHLLCLWLYVPCTMFLIWTTSSIFLPSGERAATPIHLRPRIRLSPPLNNTQQFIQVQSFCNKNNIKLENITNFTSKPTVVVQCFFQEVCVRASSEEDAVADQASELTRELLSIQLDMKSFQEDRKQLR